MVNVYIWKSTISEAAGHAALEIVTRHRTEYVSWHPKDAPKIPSYQETFGEGVDSHLSESYRSEVREKGRQADYVIELSRINERAMLEFWDEWRKKNARFQLLKQNCSHVVSKLLMAGWLGTFETAMGKVDDVAVSKKLETIRENFYHDEVTYHFKDTSTRRVWDVDSVGGSPLAKIARYAVGALGLLMMVNENNKGTTRVAGGVLLTLASITPELDTVVWDSKSVSALAYYIKKETYDED